MKPHKRNTAGLIKATKERQEHALQRVQTALLHLTQTNQSITVTSVAKTARVAKSWIYGHAEIKQEIAEKRAKDACLETGVQISSASKEALIETLKKKISHLRSENHKLKRQLETVYGELHLKSKI